MSIVEKGKPIKDRLATRDINSGAVVYNDTAGYQKAVKRKRAGKNILAQQKLVSEQATVIEEQKKKLETLEWKMNQILKKIDKNG